MDNLFSGLESMGLKMGNINIFDEDKKDEKKAEVKKPVVVDEASFLLDKTTKCPLCDSEFKAKLVKTGKAKLLKQDIDLRPRYQDIDVLKYGVITCPTCGYSAMLKVFPALGSAQSKLIKTNISASFTGLGPEHPIYSYDDAIARHKLALVNAVVKKSKLSERAYLCMLLGWLLRTKRETLPGDYPHHDEVVKKLLEEEKSFLAKAKEGFKEAFSKEGFPLYALDETTSIYVIAALSAETGSYDEALRWVSQLITSHSANDRIKEKGRLLKEMIQKKEI